jgi:hypothetical protein
MVDELKKFFSTLRFLAKEDSENILKDFGDRLLNLETGRDQISG